MWVKLILLDSLKMSPCEIWPWALIQTWSHNDTSRKCDMNDWFSLWIYLWFISTDWTKADSESRNLFTVASVFPGLASTTSLVSLRWVMCAAVFCHYGIGFFCSVCQFLPFYMFFEVRLYVSVYHLPPVEVGNIYELWSVGSLQLSKFHSKILKNPVFFPLSQKHRVLRLLRSHYIELN